MEEAKRDFIQALEDLPFKKRRKAIKYIKDRSQMLRILRTLSPDELIKIANALDKMVKEDLTE